MVFSASGEANEPTTQEGDWVLVEGTQKRRQIVPKGRGRPKAFKRIDNSHGNIDKFIIPRSQSPLAANTPTLATQEPPLSSKELPESMNVD